MKTKIILGTSMLLLVGSIAITGCKKREKTPEKPADTEANTARDNANSENISNDIIAIGGELTESGSLTQYRSNEENSGTGLLASTCATISLSGSTITVDFGTTGCQGLDGRTRKGKLIYDLSGCTPSTSIHYRNPGFKMVVKSQNYMVDSNLVSISGKTITNTTPTGFNPSVTGLSWHIQSNISITKPNGSGTITWSCDRTKELTNTGDANCYHGQTLPITWSLAKIKLNGTASGVNAKGESYTAVATDLVRDFTCTPSTLHPKRHPFISGKIDYKPGTRPTRYFDYGDGGCDLNATVTLNGVTYAVTLP